MDEVVEREQLLADLHNLRELAKHQGWDLFVRMLSEQEEIRRRAYEAPLESMDGVLGMEFLKGELLAFKWVQEALGEMIEEVETELEELETEEEKSDE